MKEEDRFVEYLMAKKLAEKTINHYFLLFKHLQKKINAYGLTQSTINKFILNRPSNVTRAFVTNFIEFYNLRDVKVIRQTGRKPRKKYPTISNGDMKILREELYKDAVKFGLLLDLSYYCALRKSEALGIMAENFDWMQWKEDPTKPLRLKITGKGGRDRIVIVPPSLAEILEAFILSLDYLESETPLFQNVKTTTWQDHFKKVVREKLKKDYTLHDLRRSRATNWYSRGQDLIKIKTKLGHASISTTQLYINPDEEKVLKEWEHEY